jgi:hypothetical protein
MDDWTTVVPPQGQVAETARELLALARTPGDVRTSAGGTEFRIPPYLADLYTAPQPAPKARRRSSRKEGDE